MIICRIGLSVVANRAIFSTGVYDKLRVEYYGRIGLRVGAVMLSYLLLRSLSLYLPRSQVDLQRTRLI